MTMIEDGEAVYDGAPKDDTDQPTESLYDEIKPEAADTDTEAKEKKPRKHREPRQDASRFLTMVALGAGKLLERRDAPVGRCVQFQAPLTGNQLDKVIAGTFIDTMIQPFVKGADKAEGLGAIFAMPLMVAMYEHSPESRSLLEPIMTDVMAEILIDMAPLIKKRATDQKRAARSMGDVMTALGVDPGDDPAVSVLGTFFAAAPTEDDMAEAQEASE